MAQVRVARRTSHRTKAIRSTSIRHRSDAKVSDRCWIYVDPWVFSLWDTALILQDRSYFFCSSSTYFPICDPLIITSISLLKYWWPIWWKSIQHIRINIWQEYWTLQNFIFASMPGPLRWYLIDVVIKMYNTPYKGFVILLSFALFGWCMQFGWSMHGWSMHGWSMQFSIHIVFGVASVTRAIAWLSNVTKETLQVARKWNANRWTY